MSNKTHLVIGAVALSLFAGVLVGNSMATSKAEEAMDKLVADAKSSGATITYDNISASILGNIDIDDLSIDYQGSTITVASVSASGLKEDPKEMDSLALTFSEIGFSGSENMRIDETPDDISEALAYAAFKDGKTFDLSLDMNTDAEDGEISINDITLRGEDLGEVTLQGEFVSAGLFADEFNPMSPIQLGELSLTLSDDGLIDILMMNEVKGDKSLDDVREKAISKGERAVERSKGFEKELMQGMIALIEGDEVTLKRLDNSLVDINPIQLFSNQRAVKRLSEQAQFTVVID